MIYLVSKEQKLFTSDYYKEISVEDALIEISSWDCIQFDTETNGRDPHINKLLCAQFGNDKASKQIVVDCLTIDISLFKSILETKLIIGHNLKFDIQFLYKYNIVPTNVFDTMVIEQLLHLGFDNKFFHYNLHDVAERYLGINIDKSIRNEINQRGLDESVIIYAAGDVTYLEQIKEKEEEQLKISNSIIAGKIENKFVPVIAYLEWCGIKLDIDKWSIKMKENEDKANKALIDLNNWLVSLAEQNHAFKQYTFINRQGDLFSGFDLTPKCTVNWSSSKQVIKICKLLGFNTSIEDKKTGQIKDSINTKILQKQKGINDDFLQMFDVYQKATKECSTYGQNYIDSINPITGRIHSTFWQLGAASGRMSCGSNKSNTDLAKFKGIDPKHCIYPQLQNLPSDEITRSSFIPNEGNLMTSADYSALESRLGADIYNEEMMLKEYLEGSGDIHSLTAKVCFPEELEGIDVKDIKKLRPDLRKKAKGPEFACQFGGGWRAIASAINVSDDEAKRIEQAYKEGFKGISTFKEFGSKFVRSKGYIVMCKYTGHKMYWEDFAKWKEIDAIPEFQQKFELTSDQRKEHKMAAAKWDRLALNSVTQGSGIIILKLAMIKFFKWIISNNLFNTVLICDLVHDEAVIEYPEHLKDLVVSNLVECMETAASAICKKLPIPAEAETGDHWIH